MNTDLRPRDFLERAVASYEPYLQADGELHDPLIDQPTQYGTAYHALAHAVLARFGGQGRGAHHAEAAARGLDAGLRHVGDMTQPPTVSGLCGLHEPGTSAINHRDFFWPAILRTHRLLCEGEAADYDAAGFVQRIAAVDVERSFFSRPPSNWAMVWLSGEWQRISLGLSPFDRGWFDGMLGVFFERNILIEQGFYQEPGHSNSYDLFTRLHLAQVLAAGYDGAHAERVWELMRTGCERSLDVQLSDGSLGSAHRSTGQTWTVGGQVSYFTLAARLLGEREPALADRAGEAARLAFASLVRYQRAGGPFSPVENCLPPERRCGYEPYTLDGHYGNLALGFLGLAVADGFDGQAAGREESRAWVSGGRVRIEHDPTWRAVAHHGRYSVHANGWPSQAYDGFGITDLTVGPGRVLQFVSSVKPIGGQVHFNLGLAIRGGGAHAQAQPIAQMRELRTMTLEATGPAGFELAARPMGKPWTYRLRAEAGGDSVQIEEATPGMGGHKSLLVPYLRDAGTGPRTAVRVRNEQGRASVLLTHGEEQLAIEIDAAVASWLDLPWGYENRRGECGLLRLDLAEPSEAVRYRVRVVA